MDRWIYSIHDTPEWLLQTCQNEQTMYGQGR